MRTIFESILKVLGGLLLLFLALLLFVVVVPFAFLWLIVVTVKNKGNKARGVISNTGDFFVMVAASFDQLGNAAFGGFFNWLFIKDLSKGFQHGDKDDTISEVLGWNEHKGSLSRTGVWMVYVLNKIDPDHCRKAMESGVQKAVIKVSQYNNTKGLKKVII